MYCSKCGVSMADGAAFCSNCGQAFAVATTPVYSPAMAASVAVPVRGSAAAIPDYAGYAAASRVAPFFGTTH